MAEISLVALLVADYDEAIAFYVSLLGFELREDSPRPGGGRWVVVAPGGSTGTGILLVRPTAEQQIARIGDQTGGRVGFFLTTDDFVTDFARMTASGVRFLEPPRHEAYGTVAVFEDLYGNCWDLLEPARTGG